MPYAEESQLAGRLEEVAIEAIHVGDYVQAATAERGESTWCVLRKLPLRATTPPGIAGWHLQLGNGDALWLPPRARLQRRSFGRVGSPTAPASGARARHP
jgi:hypothetical protein